MSDDRATFVPADLPLDRRCRCGARVLRTLTASLSREVALDRDPAAAGLYRLTAAGLAEAVGAGAAAAGERLYSPHRCPRTPADDAGGEEPQ